MPPEQANQSDADSEFYERYRNRKKTFRWIRYAVVFGCILMLGLVVLYLYSGYRNEQAARQRLSRAESLVQEHRYEKAQSVISDQLLTKYPETEAAAKGRTLEKNLKELREWDERTQVFVRVGSSDDGSDPEQQLKGIREDLDRLNRMERNFVRFIREEFGSLIDEPDSSPVVHNLTAHQKRLSNRASDLRETIVRETKTSIRSLIENQQYSDALKRAKSVSRKYQSDTDNTEENLKELAEQWIREAFRDTRDRVRELEAGEEYSAAIRRVQKALKQFSRQAFQKKLNKDLNRLQERRASVKSEKAKQQEQDEERATADSKPSSADKTRETSDGKPEDVPFNDLTLVTEDRQKVSGRVLNLDGDRVELQTEQQTRTYRLSDVSPSSAAQILQTAGHTERAIRYSMEHDAYRQARRLIAASEQRDQAWKQANVKAANAFLNGAVRMSPSQLRKTARKKEEWLKKQAQKNDRDNGRSHDDPNVHSVSTIVYKGDVSRRLDIVFVNDGWTKKEQERYNRICNKLVRRLLRVEPFSNYKRYINFHRVNLISDQSRIDGSTVLGSSPSLRPDYNKVLEYAGLAPDTDLVVNVINSDEGRANGTRGLRPGIMNINMNGRIGSTFIHELGHAFAGLDDEYVEAGKRGFSRDEEDEHINTTRVSDPLKVKWHYWKFPEPPEGRRVGTFEGAHYQEEGYYRPSPTCRMKNSSDRFCVVCFEQMEKSFYHNVSPLGAVHPPGDEITLFLGENRNIQARTVVTTTKDKSFGTLDADWYLDGAPVEETSSETLRTWVNTGDLSLSPGTHEIGVRVDFFNRRVRRDNGLLTDAHVWKLRVLPYPEPQLRIGGQRQTAPGSELTLSVQLDERSRQHNLRVKPLERPAGARFVKQKNLLSWTPTARQVGSHVFRIGVVNADQEVVLKRNVQLTVRKRKRSNHAPVMYLPPKLTVKEGESIDRTVNAWDPDHDFLTFQLKDAPEDLTINPKTGRLHWSVGYNHGFERTPITVVVTDGRKEISKEVKLEVRDQPLPAYDKLNGYIAKQALRKRDPRTVIDVFEDQMMELPRTFQFMEAMRLLRHADESVRSKAITHLQTLLSSQNPTMKKRFLRLLFTGVKPHMFHFTDAPDVMDFLESLTRKAKGVQGLTSVAGEVYDRLQKNRTYNKKRGVDFN